MKSRTFWLKLLSKMLKMRTMCLRIFLMMRSNSRIGS